MKNHTMRISKPQQHHGVQRVAMLTAALSLCLIFAPTGSWAQISSTGNIKPGGIVNPTWNVGNSLGIGVTADGTLVISTGGTVNENGVIAFKPGVTGNVTVSGGNWTNTGALGVGYDGNGGLVVNSNGSVSSAKGAIAFKSGSNSFVNVTNGTWTNSGPLAVGYGGTGQLTLSTDGKVSSQNTAIGFNAGSNGTATLNGGNWTNTGALAVGFGSTGTLIVNSGAVSSQTSAIGFNANATGYANVAGGNWTTAGALAVGFNGNGTLAINGGGLVSSNTSAIGFGGNSTGFASVINGTWTNTGVLATGFNGKGDLFIGSNGNVTSQTGVIGFGANSTGNVTVTNGTWTNAGALAVGDNGNGTLVINGGGLVSSNTSAIGFGGNSTGFASVINGTWTNTASLAVGYNGNGTLVIGSNGNVTNEKGAIGFGAGSTGNVTVSNGTWTNTGAFAVGLGGTGGLQVENGGLVSSQSSAIGYNANSTGLATVTNATWNNTGPMVVGLGGNGALDVNPGGLVTTTTLAVAAQPGSVGAVNLQNGTLITGQVVSGAGNGTFTFNGGLLQLTGNQTSLFGGFLPGEVVMGPGGGTIDTQGFTVTALAGMSGSGSLTKIGNGTLILTGNSTYEDGTFINEGTLQIGRGGATGDIAGDVVDNSALVFNRANIYHFDGVITGNGTVTQIGSGFTYLSQDNLYSGTTTVTSGVLGSQDLVNSSVRVNGGAFTAGNINDIESITVDSMLLNGGSLVYDLGPKETSDFITADGPIVLAATDTRFVFNDDNFKTGVFELMTGNLVNFGDVSGLTFVSNIPNLQGLFGVSDDILYFRGYFPGEIFVEPVLSNFAPWLIPVTGDFLVRGFVTTLEEDESTTINSLILAPDSTLRIYNLLTVTSGDFTVDAGSATIFGGRIEAPGEFHKKGRGILVLNSPITVGGAATVSAGGLVVNNTFNAAGGFSVFQGAFLGGSGIINGNVFNNGRMNPGNSPGTLTVNGDFTQSASGRLQIEVVNPAIYDILVVSGRASLAGTLEILASSKSLKYGQQVPFLRAGSIAGGFDEILMPDPSKFRGRFLTDGGLGSVLVAPTSYTLVAETTNQRNVAKALDRFITARGDDRETVSIALDLQTEEQYPASLDQIAPTFHESSASITLEQAFSQTQMLNQRSSAVRLGAKGFLAMGMKQEPLVNDKDGKSVADPKDLKSVVDSPLPTRWSAWTMGTGLFGKVTNVSQVPNFRFESGGFLVGADYDWNLVELDWVVTVFYTGYAGTFANYNGGGDTAINSALFGVYASYTKGAFYADAVVGGGYSNYRVNRPIEFSTIERTARSSEDGGQFSAALNLGYDWKVGGFTFGPIAGVQYTYVGIAPFTESGADSLDLRVSQQNVNSLRTTFGGRVAFTWNVTDKITIIPEVRMFWLHEFLNNPRVIGATLDGGNGAGFDYLTSAPDRDSVYTGAGISAQFGDRWNASFYYNADFGRQDYIGHAISATLGLDF